jgi:hypothetical protein
LFANWLYDKWKKNGEKKISIKIENRFYQFDVTVLTKTLEEVTVVKKAKKRAGQARVVKSWDRRTARVARWTSSYCAETGPRR